MLRFSWMMVKVNIVSESKGQSTSPMGLMMGHTLEVMLQDYLEKPRTNQSLYARMLVAA